MGNVLVWLGILGLGMTLAGKAGDVYTGVHRVVFSRNFIPWIFIMGAAGLLADSTEGKAKPLVQSFVVLLFISFLFSNQDLLTGSTQVSQKESDNEQ